MLAWRLLVGFALLGLAPVACHRCDPEPEPVPVPASEPTPLPVPPTVAASEPKPLPADLSLISFDKPLGDEQAGIGKPLFPTVVIDGVECDFRDLEPVAREFFAKGQYKEALDAYTLWRPSSWCGTCLSSMHSERYSRIALGHVHLGDYPAAVRTCFEPIGQKDLFRGNANEFLVQLYREAGQLDDLKQFLDAVEKAAVEKHPKWWLLTPADHAELVKDLGTRGIRYKIMLVEEGRVEEGWVRPWPEGVPKPKPGSLPKTLPK